MTEPQEHKPVAPTKFPWWGWAIVGALVLGGIGSFLGVGDDDPDAQPTPTVSAVDAADESPTVEVEPTTDATEVPPSLLASRAQVQCDAYGESEFPYGYKPHWFLGKIAEEQQSDTQWWFKLEVTITNQFDAERDLVVECTVDGTNDAAAVSSFIYY